MSSPSTANAPRLGSSGTISGMPTTPGTFNGTVTASNGSAPADTQDFSIFIALPPDSLIFRDGFESP